MNSKLAELQNESREHAEELGTRAEAEKRQTTPVAGPQPCRKWSGSGVDMDPVMDAAGDLDRAASSGRRSPSLSASVVSSCCTCKLH